MKGKGIRHIEVQNTWSASSLNPRLWVTVTLTILPKRYPISQVARAHYQSSDAPNIQMNLCLKAQGRILFLPFRKTINNKHVLKDNRLLSLKHFSGLNLQPAYNTGSWMSKVEIKLLKVRNRISNLRSLPLILLSFSKEADMGMFDDRTCS